MTDRLKGVWVAFDEDIREDDAEPIIHAIKQLRHVQAVEPHVSDLGDWVAQQRVREELWVKIHDVFFPKAERKP